MYGVEVVFTELSHLDDIIEVENLSFKIPWSREAFIEELTKNKLAIYLSAQVEGKVIGYAGMWKICEEGHITNIAVHPEFRGNNVGTLLLKGLIEVAANIGVYDLTLEVRRSNLAAQKLYSKFGFAAGGVRRGYYGDNNEDAIIMWRNGI